MRRSRRKGQLRRTSSMRRRSHGDDEDFLPVVRGAASAPRRTGRMTNDAPQNSKPPPAGPSWPTRLTAATKTPLAIAWERWISSHAWCCASAVLRLLVRVPADRRRVDQHFRAVQRRQPRPFGIPLVPAHQHADAAEARVEGAEAGVAGREIILLVSRAGRRGCASCDRGRAGCRRRRRRPRCCGTPRRRGARTATPTITTPASRATRARRSVEGPGIGSARSNRAGSSRWQK